VLQKEKSRRRCRRLFLFGSLLNAWTQICRPRLACCLLRRIRRGRKGRAPGGGPRHSHRLPRRISLRIPPGTGTADEHTSSGFWSPSSISFHRSCYCCFRLGDLRWAFDLFFAERNPSAPNAWALSARAKPTLLPFRFRRPRSTSRSRNSDCAENNIGLIGISALDAWPPRNRRSL
jgi:hypothetical protein